RLDVAVELDHVRVAGAALRRQYHRIDVRESGAVDLARDVGDERGEALNFLSALRRGSGDAADLARRRLHAAELRHRLGRALSGEAGVDLLRPAHDLVDELRSVLGEAERE